MKDNEKEQKNSAILNQFSTKLEGISHGTFLSDTYNKKKGERAGKRITSIGVGACDAFAASSFKLGCKSVIITLANSKGTIGGVYFKIKSKDWISKIKDLSKYANEIQDSGKFRIAPIEESREVVGKDIVIQPGAVDKFNDQYTGHFGLKDKP